MLIEQAAFEYTCWATPFAEETYRYIYIYIHTCI
jgi:hypothetical protein